MKLYVKAISTYRSDRESLDIKKELKRKYKLDTRRQDSFIHLSVFGAQRLKESAEIKKDDELFLTSGVGNIDVIARTNLAVIEKGEFIKPFDFINMLGNTTSYYVATSLGVQGKNIFDISDSFPVLNSLILIYSSLFHSKKEALFGSIDLISESEELIRRVMGIAMDMPVVSSVNYQKLSLQNSDALAELEFSAHSYSKEELLEIVNRNTERTIYKSMRCKEFPFQANDKFFATDASYFINYAISNKEDILYIDFFEGRYKILKVSNL